MIWIVCATLHTIGKIKMTVDLIRQNKKEKYRQVYSGNQQDKFIWVDNQGRSRLVSTDEICYPRKNINGDNVIVSSIDGREICNCSKQRREKTRNENKARAISNGDLFYIEYPAPPGYRKFEGKHICWDVKTDRAMYEIAILSKKFYLTNILVDYETENISYILVRCKNDNKYWNEWKKVDEQLEKKYKELIEYYNKKGLEYFEYNIK